MLREYQKEDLKKWIMTGYRGGWYWEPGLGKTFSASYVIKQLLRKRKIRRVMIAGPLLAVNTLKDFLTDVMKIPESIIYNYCADPKKPYTDEHRIFIINYELLPPPKNDDRLKIKSWFDDDGVFHMEQKMIGPVRKRREFPEDLDLWVLDESHMLKSHSSNAFKFFKKHIKRKDKVLCLSGTPFPNRHTSCYTQLDLIYPGILGKNISAFRTRYCRLLSKEYGTYAVKEAAVEHIEAIARRFTTVRKADDHLDLPEHTDIMLKYYPTDKQLSAINILRKDGVVSIDNGEDLLLSSGSVARIMTQQILTGYVDMNVTRAVIKDKVQVSLEFGVDPKYNILKQLLDSMGNKKLIICVYFTETSSRLRDLLTGDGYKVDRFAADDKKNFYERLEAFTDGDVQILISHPAIIGVALNNMVKVNYMLWYELTDNWAVYKQMVDRIHRFGQMNPTFCFHLIGHRTEEVILEALGEKADVNDRLAEKFFNEHTFENK